MPGARFNCGTAPRLIPLRNLRRATGAICALLAIFGTGPVSGQKPDVADDQPAAEAAPRERIGQLIKIESPITERVEMRVKRVVDEVLRRAKQEEGGWPVLIFEIRPGQSDFGKALDLALYISGPALGGATTVAYIPETVTGHAVLVALACEEIIMHADAQIGSAGARETTIVPVIRDGYVTVAERRNTVDRELALGMLDPALEILEVETDVSREFILREDFDDLKKERAVKPPKVVVPAGEAGLFSGRQGRDLGFVSRVVEDRDDMARSLGLPRESLEEDPSLVGGWRPVRVDIKGPIGGRTAAQVQNLIDDELNQNNVNFVVLWIDSDGGAADESFPLANYLTSLDPAEVRTVAYVPQRALADAAAVAIACDHIVMLPGARLGGSWPEEVSPEDLQAYAGNAAEIAASNQRCKSLAAAMFDPHLAVYRYTRPRDGFVDYFSEAEAAELPPEDEWRQGELVTTPGEMLAPTGQQAEQLGIAWQTVEDFAELKQIYGLEGDPTLIEPGWAEHLIYALNTAAGSIILLAIGFWALYAEMQAPGIGLGAFVGGLCFLLFFWSHYLDGTATWLEVCLFAAGIVCLLLEVFALPGFGIFGVGGGLLILASLILASQTFYVPRNATEFATFRTSMGVVAGAIGLLFGGAVVIHRYWHRTPILNRMLLSPPSFEEREDIAQRESLAAWSHLLGEHGQTTTQLTPAGKARFGRELVDVISEGDLIQRGRPIEVIEVRGSRVVVREVE